MTQRDLPDYDRLLNRLRAALSGEQLMPFRPRMTSIGEVDGLSLPVIHLGEQTRRVLFIAGTHGDEPASVEAAATLMETLPLSWLDRFGIDVLACTNPTGWLAGTRENAQGVDINWAFDRTDVPEVPLLKAFLAGRRWQVIVDFHEDWEATGFYLYEHRFDGPYIGPAVIEAVRPVCPIEPATTIDGWTAEGGVIHADDSKARLLKGDGLPLVLLRDHTGHKTTTETPSSLPMAQRVAAHLAAARQIVAHHLAAN